MAFGSVYPDKKKEKKEKDESVYTVMFKVKINPGDNYFYIDGMLHQFCKREIVQKLEMHWMYENEIMLPFHTRMIVKRKSFIRKKHLIDCWRYDKSKKYNHVTDQDMDRDYEERTIVVLEAELISDKQMKVKDDQIWKSEKISERREKDLLQDLWDEKKM